MWSKTVLILFHIKIHFKAAVPHVTETLASEYYVSVPVVCCLTIHFESKQLHKI